MGVIELLLIKAHEPGEGEKKARNEEHKLEGRNSLGKSPHPPFPLTIELFSFFPPFLLSFYFENLKIRQKWEGKNDSDLTSFSFAF